MYEWASTRLPEAGMQQYEISNWCVPGYEARHNLQYWRNLPYARLGPRAHEYLGGARTILLLVIILVLALNALGVIKLF